MRQRKLQSPHQSSALAEPGPNFYLNRDLPRTIGAAIDQVDRMSACASNDWIVSRQLGAKRAGNHRVIFEPCRASQLRGIFSPAQSKLGRRGRQNVSLGAARVKSVPMLPYDLGLFDNFLGQMTPGSGPAPQRVTRRRVVFSGFSRRIQTFDGAGRQD